MARAFLAVTFGNSAATILGAVGGVLVARFVDPETAGRFRAYSLPLMYLAALHLGTFDALSRQLPLLMGQGRREQAEDAAAAAAGWTLVLVAALSGVFALLTVGGAARGDLEDALGWGTQLGAVWWIFYGGYLAATFRTTSQFAAMARVQGLQAGAGLVLVFAVPYLGFAGLALRVALPAVLGTWLLHRARPVRRSPTWAPWQLAGLIRIGLPFSISGSLYTSLWNALEGSLILAWSGPRVLGFYSVAVVLRDGISLLPIALNQVLSPKVVEDFGRKGALAAAVRGPMKLVLPSFAAMCALSWALMWALGRLLPIALPQYADGLQLMRAVLWFGPMQALALPLSGLLAAGESKKYGRGVVAGFCAFVLGSWALSRGMDGCYAVVAGSLIGKAVRTAMGYWDLRSIVRAEAA